MMNKKIAYVGPLPPPLGGVAVINLSFQNIEYENYYHVSFNTSNGAKRENLYKKPILKSILTEISKSVKLKNFLKDEKPDVVNIFVTSGYSILRDILFLRIIKRFNLPVIVHFHSKTCGEFALEPERLKILGRVLNKYADKIIVLSKKHFDYFIKFFPEEKCAIIENFVDYELFDNVISKKDKDFLFVGRLSKEKGFFDLIEAVKILNEQGISPEINVIGLAVDEKSETLIEKTLKNHKLDNINLLGFVEGEEKYRLFKRHRYLIFPSHFENSPVVIKEAIAAKMGIISSNIEANIELLKGKENTLFHDMKNPISLASKIKELNNDRKLGDELCHASSRVTLYSKHVAKNKLIAIFEELNLP